jgi:hypothetical protein
MNASNNGINPTRTASSAQSRRPRRLVLLAADEGGAIEQILTEYHDAEVSGVRLHADLQRLAAEHPGRLVAAEWLGRLGWTRFLWCRK